MIDKIISTLDTISSSTNIKYMDIPSLLAYDLLSGIANEIGSGIGERLRELITDAKGKRKLREYSQEKYFKRWDELIKLVQDSICEFQTKQIELQLKEIESNWDLENWNGILNRQETAELLTDQKDSLLIFISPPEISQSVPASIRDNLQIELNSTEFFLNNYYPEQNQQHPVKVYTDYFKRSVGNISIDRLQKIIGSIATAIMAIDMTDSDCNIKIYLWGLANNENRLCFSKQWNWENRKKELISQGVSEDEALKMIRQTIVTSYKILAAYIVELYYLKLNPYRKLQSSRMAIEVNKHGVSLDNFNACNYKLQEIQESIQKAYQKELNLLSTRYEKQEIYEIAKNFSHVYPVYWLALAHDGQTLISHSDNNFFRIWNLNTGELLHTITSCLADNSNTITLCNEKLISCDRKSQAFYATPIKVWDLKSGKLLHSIECYSGSNSIIIAPDKQTLISYGHEELIKVWDLKSGKLLHTIEGYLKDEQTNLRAITSDSEIIVGFDCKSKNIKVWNLKSGELLHTIDNSSAQILTIAPDDKTLIARNWGRIIKIWNLTTGQLLHTLESESLTYRTLWRPDILVNEEILVNWVDKQDIEIWDIQTGQLLHTFKNLLITEGFYRRILIAPDRKTLVIWFHGKIIKTWNFKTGQLLNIFENSLNFSSILIAPDSKTFISGSHNGHIEIWDLETGQLLQTLKDHSTPVYSLVITPDGKSLISGSRDGGIKVWNLVGSRIR